jgi:hypothetical protein
VLENEVLVKVFGPKKYEIDEQFGLGLTHSEKLPCSYDGDPRRLGLK